MPTIDLNADIGEGGYDDPELMQHATSVNIACGGHAGDPAIMRMTIEASKAHGVAVGAHPGYEDPDNFGRVELDLSPDELTDQMKRQLERFLEMHPDMHHVKPHGALYTQANVDAAIAATVVLAIMELKPDTLLYCPPSGELVNVAMKAGLKTCGEGFIDRTYLACGNLTPRSETDAVIDDFGIATGQAMQMVMMKSIEAIDGSRIPLPAETLCVHGDNPDAPDLLLATREFLGNAGVDFASPQLTAQAT